MRQVREVVGAATIDPALLTAAERIQTWVTYGGRRRNAAIRALAEAGVPIRRSANVLATAARCACGPTWGAYRRLPVRQSSLDAYLPWLDAQWMLAAERDRTLAQGEGTRLPGSLRVVAGMGDAASTSEQAKIERLQRVPSARTLARWLTTGRDRLTKAETLTVAAVRGWCAALVEAREVVGAFQTMSGRWRRTGSKGGSRVLAQASSPSFARGVGQDRAAVLAAITLPWSNGQTEGQITPNSSW